MFIVIRTGEKQTHVTARQLHNEARGAAKQAGAKFVRHWVECLTDSGAVRLRVEVKRKDGLGEILAVAL